MSSARLVDLRSDTVTKPTDSMYQRMRTAPVGDDGQEGDPSALELQETAAQILGKDAALFVPTCTMGNLLAVLAHAQRGDQVVLESETHMYTAERASATFTGAIFTPVAGAAGVMNLELLENVLEDHSSRLKTKLIVIETTHNNAGGTVLPLAHMSAVKHIAEERGIAVHLDGARLFNAVVHLQGSATELTQYCDTVSVCLSKGLSAPVGAILAGSRPVIEKARTLRRMLGGQQRQIGIMAAAGLEAINHMVDRLVDDHVRAAKLSQAVASVHPQLQTTEPQTNILQVDVSRTGRSPEDWVRELSRHGLLVRAWTGKRLRCVTHRHIEDQDIEHARRAFQYAVGSFAL